MRPAIGLLVLALGKLVGVGVATVMLREERIDNVWLHVAIVLTVGWAFVDIGLLAWRRRPENRTGALMVLVGFSWFLGPLAFSDVTPLAVVGLSLGWIHAALFLHLLLAYPRGRLNSRPARILVGVAWFDVTVVQVARLMVSPPSELDPTWVENHLSVWESERTETVLQVVQDGGGVVMIAMMVGLLVTRWRRATPPGRRVLAAVLPAGILAATLLAVSILLQLTGSGTLRAATDVAGETAFAAVPLMFLAGMVRSQARRSGSVGGLVVELGTRHGDVDLRAALRRALRDETLEIVYCRADGRGYVDAQGRAVDPSDLPRGRAATEVARGGQTVAALVHDSALRDDPSLVDAVSAAAGLALENERLQAELRARLDELRASRARIVEAGDAERRRLERNLHDGAQQRLVVLSLGVRMARNRLEADPAGAGALLEDAGAQLELALEELRELARGIHPAVLTDRGLGPALESLVGRSPVPVALERLPATRLPASAEVAAYFVVAEALTNVVKYASASKVTVDVSEQDGNVVVEIVDDGVGGADPRAGSGLRGLADRVEALDGLLHVTSRPGEGTTVRAVIPCGS